MLVHDLKNPLAVIVSNYAYILEGIEGPPDCLEALRDSQSAGLRMLRLLANLVDVARLEDGTLTLDTAAVDLSSLLRPIAEQRRVLARARKISMIFTPSSEATAVLDPDLLTRTLENILDNAFQHTPTGGSIEIESREVGPDVEIRIGNTGGAIPLGAHAAIFEKYGQAGSPVGHMNLGLGLYFCRLAVEAHGGQIWVEETARLPTVFAIRLPRAPSPAVRPPPVEPPGAQP
jgi:signal transduction histidine kinase